LVEDLTNFIDYCEKNYPLKNDPTKRKIYQMIKQCDPNIHILQLQIAILQSENVQSHQFLKAFQKFKGKLPPKQGKSILKIVHMCHHDEETQPLLFDFEILEKAIQEKIDF